MGRTQTNYQYDANGNLTQQSVNGQSTTYTWDGENRLTHISHPDGHSESYLYDGDGLRREKVTTAPDGTQTTLHFLWDGQNLLQEKDGQGATLAHYTDSPGAWGGLTSMQRDAQSRFYLHSPHNENFRLNLNGFLTHRCGLGEMTHILYGAWINVSHRYHRFHSNR